MRKERWERGGREMRREERGFLSCALLQTSHDVKSQLQLLDESFLELKNGGGLPAQDLASRQVCGHSLSTSHAALSVPPLPCQCVHVVTPTGCEW